MAKKDAPDDSAAGEGGKKKKKLIPAIVVFVVVAAGAYFMLGKSCDEECQALAAENVEVVEGPIVPMEAISINLSGGHFLKVMPALQLAEGGDPALYEDGQAAKAADLIIETLGGRKMASLSTGKGRNAAKDELREQLGEIYDGDVIDIYFTEFVMQ